MLPVWFFDYMEKAVLEYIMQGSFDNASASPGSPDRTCGEDVLQHRYRQESGRYLQISITEFWYQDKACDRTGNHFTDTCDNGKCGVAESLNHKPDDIYKGKQDVSS